MMEYAVDITLIRIASYHILCTKDKLMV